MKYWLVGIKGSGMSALASYLYDMGNMVMGSDVSQTFDFESGLIKRNIEVLPFSKNNISPNYIYIISNAYHLENEEVQEIIKNGYKYYYYHEYISTLPGIKIGISGAHGKTTTSFFLKELLKDESIACIIGDGTGFAEKNYKYLIFEACEYQDHFLSYKPDILVITNIDFDHPDYFKNINHTIDSFYKASKNAKKVVTLSCINYEITGMYQNYSKVLIDDYEFILNVVGIHNIYNFILCYKVLKLLGFTNEYIKKRCTNLIFPTRRMEETKIKDLVLIEDYGHHPNEINALYQSINIKYPNYPKIVLFQPHTYSRTISLISGFLSSLKKFDDVYIDKVFTSKREPYNVELEILIQKYFSCFKKYKDFNKELLDKKVIIVLLGAGDLNRRFKDNILNNENIFIFS